MDAEGDIAFMTPPSFASRHDRREIWANDVTSGSTVSDPTFEPAAPSRLQDDKTLPGIVYALHIAGVVTGGITCVIAVILAYISRKDAPEWLASHYEFQIRTFWLGLALAIGATLLTPLGIGLLLLPAVGVWIVVRCVVGLSNLLKGQPYPTPRNWML
jgi:uncharacterized membrane protein